MSTDVDAVVYLVGHQGSRIHPIGFMGSRIHPIGFKGSPIHPMQLMGSPIHLRVQGFTPSVLMGSEFT